VDYYHIRRRFVQVIKCFSTKLDKDLHGAGVVRVEWIVVDPVEVVLNVEFRLAARIVNPILHAMTASEEPPDFR
jgi:hypothetical protein